MPAGAFTPAIAAKRLAAILSKARCEEAEPEPVKGMPRISHIACSSPFSARAAMQAEHQHAVLGLRLVERLLDAAEAAACRA